jgi:hypothetical protein
MRARWRIHELVAWPGRLYIIFIYNLTHRIEIMHTTNLRKIGGSIMLAVPPAILDLLHLEAGNTVAMTVKDGLLGGPANTAALYARRIVGGV